VARLIVACPSCQARFDVSAFRPGSKIRCGSCFKILRIPDRPGGQAAPAPEKEAPKAPVPRKSRGKPSPAKAAPAPAKKKAKKKPAEAPPKPEAPTPPRKEKAKEKEKEEPKPAAAKESLVGHRINGEFEVVRKIGEGGYGSVYEAVDLTLKRQVAVKLMLREKTTNKEFVDKFLREARTAAQLSHPNIVKIHLVGFDKDLQQHFLAMEYVEGKSLSQIMKKEGVFPVDRAVNILVQAATGLAEAHKKNIIHRDIKPGNVMITSKGVVKVADFGLAKIYDPGDAASTVIGTPYFMPPEQFEGKVRDGRTDIYALGVTFYYILTLKRPFDGRTPAEVLLNIMKKEPVAPAEHNPEVPDELWRIIRKMIARSMDERYSTCEELLRDIKEFQAGAATEDTGVVYCPACGLGNPLTAEQCRDCSKSLLEPCPSCGTPDFVDAKFCGSCGASLAEEKQVKALVDEAESHVGAGRIEKALTAYQAAREISPDNTRIIEGIRQAETAQEERDEAVGNVKSLLAKGEYVEAHEAAKLASERYPGHDELGRLLEEAEDGAKDHRLSTELEKSRELLEAGELYDAVAAARSALDVDPTSDEALELLNETESALKKYAEVRDHAVQLEEEHEMTTALEKWRQALELMPSDQAAQQAVSRIQSVIDQVGKLHTRALEALEQQDLPRARAALEDAMGVHGEDEKILDALAALRREEQKFDDGMTKALEELIAGRITQSRDSLEALTSDYPGQEFVQEAAKRVSSLVKAAEWLLERGRECLNSRRPEAAALYVRAAEKLSPLDGRTDELLREVKEEKKVQMQALASVRNLLGQKEYAKAVEELDPLGGAASPHAEVAELAREASAKLREKQRIARDRKREVLASAIATARELFDVGRTEAALAACQKALRVDRNSEEARTLKREIDAALDQQQKGASDSTIKTAFFELSEGE